VKGTKLKKRKGDEVIAQRSGSVSVTKYSEQNTVAVISMYHSHDTRIVKIRGKDIGKSILVLDYNHCMDGVDCYILT
jgi:hypothetical protein